MMIDSQWIALNHPLLYSLVTLLSLLVGSLLNVIIYRLPRLLQAEFLSECRCLFKLDNAPADNINLFYPRSFCPNCEITIKARHNIPLLSYIFLRGRCAHCKTPISLRYPFVEALSCLLGVFASWQLGFSLALVFVLLFIWILVALFFIDLDHQLLPDCLTLSLLWLGLIANTTTLFVPLTTAVLSAAGAYLALWLFIKLFYLITGKIGMGNGDFKLFAAFGAWLGWAQLPLILFLASITGAIVGLIYLKIQKKSKDTPIPFGPFLCASGLISLFWGQPILTWYLGFFY